MADSKREGNAMQHSGLCSAIVIGICTAILGLLTAAPTEAALIPAGSFGGPGTGRAEFSGGGGNPSPNDVALNFTTGDIYVTDRGNHRVQQFDHTGQFIRMWGSGVNQTTGGDTCPVEPTDVCQAGFPGGGAGKFNLPQGIVVDNSGGPAAGRVYVQDANNNRIQKFTADGQFLLTWGKEVNQTTGQNLCPESPGDVCRAGGITGERTATPPIPSGPGMFSGWSNVSHPSLTIDGSGFVYVGDANAVPYGRVQKFTPAGEFVGQIAGSTDSFAHRAVGRAIDVSATDDGDVVVAEGGESGVRLFDGDDFSATGEAAEYEVKYSGSFGGANIGHDPSNGYLFVGTFASGLPFSNGGCEPAGGVSGPSTYNVRQYHPGGDRVDCTDPSPALPSGPFGGFQIDDQHTMYFADTGDHMIRIFDVPVSGPPSISAVQATEITTKSAVIRSQVVGNLSDTTVTVEYGPEPCSSSDCAISELADEVGARKSPVGASVPLVGLSPDTTYHYRVVATNGIESVSGPDRSFTTYASPQVEGCPNDLARQQTGSSLLLDCRAYELVSAEDQGGYNVASHLNPGQSPYPGYPDAQGRVLYAVHSGGIPGAGRATNRGPDPYVATREPESGKWTTEYVGIPSDAPSLFPFSSTVSGAATGLDAFAFSGPEICNPCFPDGSAGVPVRTTAGVLEQGMAGSIPVATPLSAEIVKKPLSDDGSHLIFGSEQQFEPAGNPADGNVTIYDRNLVTDTTQVVSTKPDGSTFAVGSDIFELDVSADGSRVLIGERVSTDAEGNDYFNLYMHVGNSPASLEIVSDPEGVLFNGMTRDGTQVLFSGRASIAGDADTSADLYRAIVSDDVSVERITASNDDACDPFGNSYNSENWNTIVGGPTDCSVVAVGGVDGLADKSGAAYFMSPETFGGEGVEDAPNLYLSEPGGSPRLITTLESSHVTPLGEPSPSFERFLSPFTSPEGAAVDREDGSVYVFDTNGAELTPQGFVQKFSADGTPDTAFGEGDGKVEGITTVDRIFLGTPAGMPATIAVDNNPASPNYRDLFVPDGAGVVRRIGSDGTSEDTIPAGEGFNIPVSVGVDPTNGNIFVTVAFLFGGDTTVYVFDPNGDPIAGPNSFTTPGVGFGIAVDSEHRVYVTNGVDTRVFEGTPGSLGTPLGVLDENPALGVAVDLRDAAEVDDDVVYVSQKNKVASYQASTGALLAASIGSEVLSGTVGIGADSSSLVVADTQAKRVAVFRPRIPADRRYDSPLVIGSVRDADRAQAGNFQTTPSGDHAVVRSVLPLTGVTDSERYEVYWYSSEDEDMRCASCSVTGQPPSTDARLAGQGLSITDDGRVAFETGESLVLRDTNSRLDVYEWSETASPTGRAELISSGQSAFDSGLLSASSDGTDIFFFTRETLAANDANGTLMKIYTAREDGGLFVIPPPPGCAASDECHGPGSQVAAPAGLGTLKGRGGNVPPIVEAGCDADRLSRQARKLAQRGRKLKRRASRASGGRAAALRRQAAKSFQRSRRSSKASAQCRKQS